MKSVRLWSIRHAGWLKKGYERARRLPGAAQSLLKLIGYDRLDKPFAAIEGRKRFFVRLAILRTVHAGRNRYGLPHELSRKHCATGPVVACAKTAAARSNRK